MPKAEEELWLRRIGEGDIESLGMLYDRHAARLLGLAVRILGTRNEAEDAVHDAFVLLSERVSSYRAERGAVIAWLTTLTRNVCIDRLRRRARRPIPTEDSSLERACVSLGDPEGDLDWQTRERKVRSALARLPDAQRSTLESTFFEGLSYAELAVQLDVPLGTVKSRAARALDSLRSALEIEGFQWD